MSAPVEFRYWMREFTLGDLQQGAQPLRFDGRLYVPPALQYRYRERVPNGSELTLQWSDWQTVPIVREGSEPFDVGQVSIGEDTVRQ